MDILFVVTGVACFIAGFALGVLFYGWTIAKCLARGRLPKSLENIGFLLPEQYKRLQKDDAKPKHD